MFDVLLRELATRFGLGDQARAVLGALLALIFNPATGGFAGFVQRLRQGGLGPQVDSWLGRGENLPVKRAQLEAALGEPVMQALATQGGVSGEKLASALTALLPGVLDKLSPDAVLPATGVVPPAVAPLLQGQEAFLAQVQTQLPSVAPTVELAIPTPQPAAHTHTHAAEPAAHADAHAHSDGGMGGRWIAWAALLLALAAGAWWFASLREPAPATAPIPASLTGIPASTLDARHTLRRLTRSTVRLSVEAQAVLLDGALRDKAEVSAVVAAARSQFGDRLSGTPGVDPGLPPASGLDRLQAALPLLDVPGVVLELSGEVLDLQAAPAAFVEAPPAGLRAALDGLRLAGLFDPAARALEALPAGTLDSDTLARTLNQMRVYFLSGSHELREDSRRLLHRAALVLARAQEGSLIEVGGHTDSRGAAADNQSLSEQRAFAVLEALVAAGVHPDRLRARGYGASRPVAENSTREGRALNRRIEFTPLR